MPINQTDLQLPEEREVINAASADLTVKAAGVGEKVVGVGRKVGAGTREVGQKVASKADEISRRDFIKISVKVGRVLAVLGIIGFIYIERYGIASFIDNVASKFSVVEEKPLDPRIVEKFGADYPAWASERAQGRYGWYLNGSKDGELNITNIPQPGDKENSVWVLVYQYGVTWPFVTSERDGDVLDQTLYPLPSEDSFVNRIADDLDLNDQQRADLLQRWKFLSVDPKAVVGWLEDLKNQGVKSVTDEMIKFYSDPTGFITGANQ